MKNFFNTWELKHFWQSWLTKATNPAWYVAIGFTLFTIALYFVSSSVIAFVITTPLIPVLFLLLWRDQMTKTKIASALFGMTIAYIGSAFIVPTEQGLFLKLAILTALGTIFLLIGSKNFSDFNEFSLDLYDKLEHMGLYFIITAFIYKIIGFNLQTIGIAFLIVLILNILYETKDGIGPIIYQKLPEKYKKIDIIKHALNTDGFSVVDILAGFVGFTLTTIIYYCK